MKKVPKLSEDN